MKALLSLQESLKSIDLPDTEDRKPLPFEKELEVFFIRTFHNVEGAIKKELRRQGIPPKIGAMLAEIYRMNYPSPIELARISGRKPQTITAILNRMEDKGLVTRVTNERKKNTYRIYLTRKGLLAYQKVLDIDVFHQVIKNFSEGKLLQFRECLEEISIQIKRLTG
jgi:DNA-binding MarR family transcriptional regulator